MNWKHLFKRAGGGITIIQPPPQPPSQPTAAVGRPYFDYYIYKDGNQVVAEYRDGTEVAKSTDFAQVLTAVDQHAKQTYSGIVITPISVMMDRGLYELQSNLDLSISPSIYYIYGVGSISVYDLYYIYWGGEGERRPVAMWPRQPSTIPVKPLRRERIKLASERLPNVSDLGKYATVIRTNGHYLKLHSAVLYNVDIVIDGNYTSDTLAPDFHTYPPTYRSPLQAYSWQMYYTSIYAPFSVDTLDVNTVSVVDGDYIDVHYTSLLAEPFVPSGYNVYIFGNNMSIVLADNAVISANMYIDTDTYTATLHMFTGSYVYMRDVQIGAYAPYTRLYTSCRGQLDIEGGSMFVASINENLYVPVVEYTCPNISASVNIIRPIGQYGYYYMPIVRVMGREVPVNNTPYRVQGATTVTGDGSTTVFSLGQHNLSTVFNGLPVSARCPDSVRVTCSSTLPVKCYLSSDMQTVYAQFDAPPPAGQQVTVVWEVSYVKYCRPQPM